MKPFRLYLWIMLACSVFSCSPTLQADYVIRQQEVIVDGDDTEWEHIEGIFVGTSEQLWIGQGMVVENWKGKDDLSFQWKASWHQNQVYFLFKVRDDLLIEPAAQPNSFLNDCIEILLDPKNQMGPRYTESSQGKILHGYEMHFLPAAPHHVFLDDAIAPLYPMEMAQDSIFAKNWKGQIACSKKQDSYIVEIGFELPDVVPFPGLEIGLDVDVCDDDGEGRKSLLIWSGVNNEFWKTMDEYPKVVFK